MALKQLFLETGTGVDLHGQNYTRAARRAVEDAIHRNSVMATRALGVDINSMQVKVLIGIPNPDGVSTAEVLDALPYGQKSIEVINGGLEIPNATGSDATVIAIAAVTVSLDLP